MREIKRLFFWMSVTLYLLLVIIPRVNAETFSFEFYDNSILVPDYAVRMIFNGTLIFGDFSSVDLDIQETNDVLIKFYSPPPLPPQADMFIDINMDGQMGLPEVIYILQIISGIKK